MYTPASFRVTDPEPIADLIRQHSFATLVSSGPEGPTATHLPVLYRREAGQHGTLVSHLARANPHWRLFQSDPQVLAIFQGPHSYISPTWYQERQAVPTWNYAAVHVYGVASIIDDHQQVIELLDQTVDQYERQRTPRWTGDIPEAYRDKLVQGIVAFQITVTRIEGKFKLSQNRSTADQQGVIDALQDATDTNQRQLAQLMRNHNMDDDASGR